MRPGGCIREPVAMGFLARLRTSLSGRRAARRDVQESWMGDCASCGRSFGYRLLHCGFADMGYAYCDRCGRTALLSGWCKTIPSGAQLRVHKVIDAVTEPYLQQCECGGAFRASASPRCPHCHACLSAVKAARWIEANAPGTRKGWRWQRNWSDVYAIVLEKRRAVDNSTLPPGQ